MRKERFPSQRKTQSSLENTIYLALRLSIFPSLIGGFVAVLVMVDR